MIYACVLPASCVGNWVYVCMYKRAKFELRYIKLSKVELWVVNANIGIVFVCVITSLVT